MGLLRHFLRPSRGAGLAVALLFASAQAVAAVAVEGLRLWRSEGKTRLVFDLDAPVRHKLSTMSGPDRLVIDLEQGRLAAPLHTVEFAGTQIRSIRSGPYGPGQLRIVLDLHDEVSANSFTLAPSSGQGHRLVIDLVGGVPAQSAVRPALAQQTQASVPLQTVPANTVVSGQAAPTAAVSSSQQPAAVVSPPSPPAAPVPQLAPPRSTPLPPQPVQGRRVLIAVDAGHGGQDPGAIGPGRVREKDVVLAIARELQKRIDAHPGYRATMIRTGDYFIPLHQRRDLARARGADLFVSVHADAFTHERARGASVYALSQRGATSVSAAFLAQRENGADLIGGVDLGAKDPVVAGVLTDLSMTATLDASLGAGGRVLDSMGRIAHLHKVRVEQAGFLVLKSPDMPSILVETGFISNPLEAERLGNPGYQRNMAAAIFAGLGDYFLRSPPPGTQVALSVRAGARPSQYTITRGDTLSGIAERYRVSVADIVRTNGLGGGNDIRAGQTIVIPQT
ncbi:MAG TPA: N-acetylmuramoyl-L-alanine amidase [Pseudomonadales bacterium]|nr:N-acetylmuramoyl-L-alanine amidase [Pseudomonadales bacterium]